MNRMRRLFCEEYIKCWNQTKAARAAGYKHPHEMGYRLMKVEEIKDFIDSRLKEISMSADEVLARLAEQARADVSEFVSDHGIIDWEQVQKKGYLIKKVVHTKGKQSVIELYSSQRALELMGKHHKLFTDKVQLELGEELLRRMQNLGLSNDDIRSDPLLSGLFIQAGVEIAGITEDATVSSQEAD